jgi:hypothetical protein
MSEPSLPFSLPYNLNEPSQAALGISPEELEIAKGRSRSEDIPLIGLRFSGDWICPARRFESLEQQFGKHFERIEIPSAGPNNYGIPRKAHSVLTEDYHRLEKYNKTNTDPRKRVLAFLNSRLKPKEEVRGR